MSIVESLKTEFHKSPLLAAGAAAAVVGAVALVARHGTGGSPLTSPLDSARNPQANLSGGGGSSGGGGGGAGLGQGDPAIGVPTSSVPVQSGTATAPILSASDVAAAINQAVSGLSGSIADSNSQLQGEINQLAGAISRGQSVNEAPRAPVQPGGLSQDEAGLLAQLRDRISRWNPQAPQIAPPTPTATPAISAAPRTVAIDGQSLFSQSHETIGAFQTAFGAGAATAWVQQHEQELLHPKPPVVSAFSATPAPPPPPMPDPSGGLISNPIPGVNYGTLPNPIPQPVVFGAINLPQPLNPTPGVDYGPPQIPAPPPPTPEQSANITAFDVALQTQNPVRQQAAQPSPADAPTSDAAPARAQVSHVRIE